MNHFELWIQRGTACRVEVTKVVRFYSHFLGASVSKTKQAGVFLGVFSVWVEELEIILRSLGYLGDPLYNLGKFHHDLTVLPKPGIMVSKGNHPQMAARFRDTRLKTCP